MSATVPYSAKIVGSTGTTSTASITAPTPGNTLLVEVSLPTASAPATPATALQDNLGNIYDIDHSCVGMYGGRTVYFYRKSNIPNAPTSLIMAGSGSFAAIFQVVEAAGLDNTSPVVNTVAITDLSGGVSQSTHVANVDTTNPNDFVLLGINGSNARLLNSADGGYSVVPPETVNSVVHAAYLADAGSAGAKSTTLTFSATTAALIFGVVYKSVPSGPAVSTITGTTVTEGGNIVFTVTLSGPTSATSNFPASFSGTATGADYNNALGSATYSDGVIFSGGDFVVPSGVSSFTVTIATTQDALDEDNETLVLRVGGVDSTGGTITDDDATPSITVTPSVTVDSGDSVVLTCTLGAVSGRVTQARLVLTDGTATGGTDYTNVITNGMLSSGVTISAGVLTIPAGVTGFTITIPTAA